MTNATTNTDKRTCRCGAVHSMYENDEAFCTRNGELIRCSKCDVHGYAGIYRRIIPHTAVRYMRQHGGMVKHDNLGNWYLHNAAGAPLARMLAWYEVNHDSK